MEARNRGLFTVAITSLQYADEPSRHPSGNKLADVVELALNNFSVKGDAAIQADAGIHMGPTSTAVGAILINSLMMEIADRLTAMGFEPPIIQSSNVDKAGVQEQNRKWLDIYRDRVRYY